MSLNSQNLNKSGWYDHQNPHQTAYKAMTDRKPKVCLKCKQCGKEFYHGSSQAKYCSKICLAKFNREKWYVINPRAALSPGTAGALNELIVSADLISKGYDVFRAFSPNASCDLVIIKEKRILRVEVKSINKTFVGELSITPTVKRISAEKCDVIALVVRCSKEIVYVGLPE